MLRWYWPDKAPQECSQHEDTICFQKFPLGYYVWQESNYNCIYLHSACCVLLHAALWSEGTSSSDEHGKGMNARRLLCVQAMCQPWTNSFLLKNLQIPSNIPSNSSNSRSKFRAVCRGTHTARKSTMMMKIVLNGTSLAWSSLVKQNRYDWQTSDCHCGPVENSGCVDDDEAHEDLIQRLMSSYDRK